MEWLRPVPTIGDDSSAVQRNADPHGWRMTAEVRSAFDSVLSGRRDIRRFRPDDLDEDLLAQVLRAAHHAPSVGHSQPWRFVVIRSPDTRERAAVMADRERIRQASLMDPDRASQLLDLQLDGIREAPVGIVVCCDRRGDHAGVLGRATFVDADLWSCACAIENLWLKARAEGLGVGWVTLFRPDELRELVHAPVGVEVMGWLCVGWPDERPPDPLLERAGWSRRQSPASVTFQERWPDVDPAPPKTFLRAADRASVVAARDDSDSRLIAPKALGALDRAVDRLVAHAVTSSTRRTLVIAAADHPVASFAVSAYLPTVTRTVIDATCAGKSLGASVAASVGADLIVVDCGVDGPMNPASISARPIDPRGDLVSCDAMSAADIERLIERGRSIGSAAGRLVAIGEVGIANTTVASALCAGLLGIDAEDTVGLGTAADSAMLERKRGVVTAALGRARQAHGAALEQPLIALSALGGAEIALLSGVILGVCASDGVVVLDGFATSLAAVIAVKFEPAAAYHLLAGQKSRELGHDETLAFLGLEPILDLRLRAGEGVGACLALQLVETARRARTHVGRVVDPGSGVNER